ncbi:suppressor APC domain-containing protein 2 [Periophthalmus magnuspinnatus]|uniref:suppressor APC domain-containing protein 2 n=1 Tax=Periophthalmus magnuspinnatus TaxID=409849 RepID=UPI00145B4DEB|nr:suppressor APC domain-containing protein 2 [Periophthalmus magnuspinnatus]
MALTAMDHKQSFRMNGSGLYRKEATQGKASKVIQVKQSDYSIEGLPKAFLHSLRTLFDILDDSGRGYVHISEIESRWQGAGTQDLPAGVLGCLRRVAPPHGCLSFERFVAGLRCSMFNPENHVKVQATVHPQPALKQPKPAPAPEHKVRPLGPSNLTNTQHHLQPHLQPHLLPRPEETALPACAPLRHGAHRPGRTVERGPVAPEAGGYRMDQNHVPRPGHTHPGGIRSIESLDLESPRLSRPSGVGKSGLPRSQSESATGLTGGSRRHGRSREDQRRHTISNGVDYGMLKQMKELEQEKDSLLAGLEVVERAREWYQSQIHNVTERQRQIGQSSKCTDFFNDASQCRMNVLIPKLQEVNRCLSDLITCTGMPISPSGGQTSPKSSSSQPPPPAPPQAIQRLKDQNRLLTQEVSEKSERITQLEQEKSALIKQLFEARARSSQDTSTLDSTFI